MIEFVRNVRVWFAPERIREEGDTPDYRFSLANERTFLAWLRTAMALIGGGFAVDQFLPDLRWGWRVGAKAEPLPPPAQAEWGSPMSASSRSPPHDRDEDRAAASARLLE